jgi:hypothetical protein
VSSFLGTFFFVLFVLQVRRVGGTAFYRRLTLLISAGWVPPRLWFVAELPRPRLGRVKGADVHNDLEGSPPGRDAADPTDLLAVCPYAGGAGTSRAMAQMKPVSSRAIAVATFGFAFPRATKRRNREVRRSCAFHAMAQMAGGSASCR